MYLQLPDEKQLKLIYDEFATNEAKTNKKVKELIEWLEQEPHLPNIKNEFFLLNYLLRCKNDIDRAQETLERYYISKAKMSDLFTDRNVLSEEFRKCFDLGTFVPLPKLTAEGYRIGIYKLNGRLYSKMPSATEFVKAVQIMSLVSMKVDLHKKAIIICDFNSISMSFVNLLLRSLKRLLSLNTKVIPFRFHKIYIMNAMPAINPVIGLAKIFAKKEIGDRIEIWKQRASDIAQVLPADVLPSDYGGTEGPFQEFVDLWFAELKNHQMWLEEEEKNVADLDNMKKKKSKKEEIMPNDYEQSSTTEEHRHEICFLNLNLD